MIMRIIMQSKAANSIEVNGFPLVCWLVYFYANVDYQNRRK
jgi:hypothetical protein